MSLLFFCLFLSFWDGVSFTNSVSSQTHSMKEAGLKPTEAACFCLQSTGIKGMHHHFCLARVFLKYLTWISAKFNYSEILQVHEQLFLRLFKSFISIYVVLKVFHFLLSCIVCLFVRETCLSFCQGLSVSSRV